MKAAVCFRKLTLLPRYPLLWSIRVYQKLFSPDHSMWAKVFFPDGYCRFHPTCSEYGHQAVKKYGLVRGVFKTTWRILRCNPWSNGGVDNV